MIQATAKLQCDTLHEGDDLVIRIGGDLDEDSVFIPLEEKPSRLVIDLNDVKMINSCGLRNWVQWFNTVDQKIQVVLRNCPQAIVDQINILEGFLPHGAIVESFYIPYHCDDCEQEEFLLVHRGKEYMEATADRPQKLAIPTEKACSHCGSQMPMDLIPAKYFRFLKGQN